MDGLIQFLAALRQGGFPFRTVYDIGAHIGAWSTAIKKRALPDADFFLFEANPAYDAILASSGFQHFTTVLSNPERAFVDFYNGTNSGDSYYKETTKFYDNQTSIRLPCTTLAQLVTEQKIPLPQLIKLDTQGSELDILAGAEPFLNQVELIYTECPIVRYNAGAPNIQEYLDFFKARKFIPVRLLEAHHIENTLVQLNILFMRHDVKETYLGKNDAVRPWLP